VSGLDSISVNVETATGNVRPLLYEIQHALRRLSLGEGGTVIDLRSLPLAPGEEQQLEDELGQGEICAEIDALGQTTIRESSYPGVWLVTHRNTDQEIISKFIEVSFCPDLLKSQMDDIVCGLDRFDDLLENGAGQVVE